MSKARNLSLLSTVEAGATTDQTKADIDSLGINRGRKNLIINGGMQVAQRGTTTSLTASAHLVDRVNHSLAGGATARFTVSQSTDAPVGFANSVKWECTTAKATMTGSETVFDDYRIEGQDVKQLGYGTAAAKDMTLSFRVKSNKVGTYVVWFYLLTGAKHAGGTYTISAADTWETKSITIQGNTAQAITATTGSGLYVRFIYAAGPSYSSGTQVTSWATGVNADRYAAQTVNLADSTSNYINITGVQLELGSVATDFEHRSYGEELALCQRYYQTSGQITHMLTGRYSEGSGNPLTWWKWPVEMRAAPSVTQTGTWNSSAGYTGTPSFSAITSKGVRITSGATVVSGGNQWLSDGFINAAAEL